jgi:hypothetical protein
MIFMSEEIDSKNLTDVDENRKDQEGGRRLKMAIDHAGGVGVVAKRSRVPDQSIRRFIRGREMRRSTLVALADACDVDLEWLVSGEGTMQRTPLRARGWTIAVAIEIKFRQTAADLAWDLGIGLMNDYLFLAGTGNEPGIASMATDGLRLCVPRYPSNFMPVPELRFLQRWPSEVADEKAHPHRNLDSSVYPLGDGPAILPTRP